MFQVRTTPLFSLSRNGQVLEWNAMEWRMKIPQVAPWYFETRPVLHRKRGTSTSTSMEHPHPHEHLSSIKSWTKMRAKRQKIPGWLADLWRFCWDRRNPTVLRTLVTISYGHHYGVHTESMYQYQQWIHAIDPIHWSIRARRLGMDPVCLLGLDHACMHNLACILIGVYSGVHAGSWSFTGLFCRSHDSIRFVICVK